MLTIIKSKENRNRKIMQVPIIRSKEEFISKLGKKAYTNLKKKIKDNKMG